MDNNEVNLIAENSALKRKLQSKAEALLIISKELDQNRTEKSQYKLMFEKLQEKVSSSRFNESEINTSTGKFCGDAHGSCQALICTLKETRESNKSLKAEVKTLEQKLRDAQGDIKVLRNQLRQRPYTGENENQVFLSHQKEELVQQLETSNLKCSQMEADLQILIDEKEELVTERDAYKCKVHRLNHQLNTLLRVEKNTMVDIDALIMENRYLQERLHQTEAENDLSNQALSKYKSMLDKKRSKGNVKLGSNKVTGVVMSQKQVQQLLEEGSSSQLQNTAATLSDMKSLCTALLETLGDKSVALTHQKKANRILASRVCDLEYRLGALEGICVPKSPSQLLLDGYCSAGVDKEIDNITLECSLPLDEENIDLHSFKEENQLPSNVESLDSEINNSAEIEMEENSNECVDSNLDTISHISKNLISSGDSIALQEFDDRLPSNLEELVKNAMEEIKQESVRQNLTNNV